MVEVTNQQEHVTDYKMSPSPELLVLSEFKTAPFVELSPTLDINVLLNKFLREEVEKEGPLCSRSSLS